MGLQKGCGCLRRAAAVSDVAFCPLQDLLQFHLGCVGFFRGQIFTYTPPRRVVVAQGFDQNLLGPRSTTPYVTLSMLVVPFFRASQRLRVMTTDLMNPSANSGPGAQTEREISSPPGSINRIAFGIAATCDLMSMTHWRENDFAAAKLDA